MEEDTFYLYDSMISYRTAERLVSSGLFRYELVGVIDNHSIFELVMIYN